MRKSSSPKRVVLDSFEPIRQLCFSAIACVEEFGFVAFVPEL